MFPLRGPPRPHGARWIDDHAHYVALGDCRHLLPTTEDVSGLPPMSPVETDRLLGEDIHKVNRFVGTLRYRTHVGTK